MRLRSSVFLIFFGTVLLTWSCKKDKENTPVPQNSGGSNNNGTNSNSNKNEIEFEFRNEVAGLPIVIDKNKYTTLNKDSITINHLSYWITNVKLKNKDGNWYSAPDSYYLIVVDNSKKDESFVIKNIPDGQYDSLQFSIGIDSVKNNDISIKAGELAVGTGWNWTWDTGYIFYKIQGNYFNHTSKSYQFYEYEIGSNRNYRIVTKALPNTINLKNGSKEKLTLKSNVIDVFGRPNTIDINAYPSIINDPKSKDVADNMATIFTF